MTHSTYSVGTFSGFHVGDGRGIRGSDRVRRAPVLRRFHAVRKSFVRQPGQFGLSDFATGAGRLRGPDRVLEARPGIALGQLHGERRRLWLRARGSRRRDDRGPPLEPGIRVRRLVRRHVGSLVPDQVSRHYRRVGLTV